VTHLLEVRGLNVDYLLKKGTVRAVDDVCFHVDERRTLTIVGESGSGKSTVAHAIMGLLPLPGRFEGGEILFRGRDLLRLQEDQLRHIRGKDICMVLQDPIGSFDPVYPIGKQIVEAILAHDAVSSREAKARTIELLSRVGIPNPEVRFHQYPHQFSGGMSQRALIAMALAGNPQLLIADEPTSALDVTVQAQIMELLRELRDSYGLAIIMITHDLSLAALIADEVAVMYAGRIVEHGSVDRVFYEPQHPYTAGLLNSMLRSGERRRRLSAIKGAPPIPLQLPAGCKFNPRCPYVKDVCYQVDPPLNDDGTGHLVACHLSSKERAKLRLQRTEHAS